MAVACETVFFSLPGVIAVMTHSLRLPVRIAFALSFLLPVATGAAEEADARARSIAEKVTKEGAALFDNLDASAIAATYADQAVLTFLKDENGAPAPEVRKGRREIEAFYNDVYQYFHETIKSRNVVERAKFVSPGVLAIDGVFESNTLKPDSPKFPFHQVRREQNGKWQILSMEILGYQP